MTEHRTTRRVLSILLFLLFGAVINVAVAWAVAGMRGPLWFLSVPDEKVYAGSSHASAPCWGTWVYRSHGAKCVAQSAFSEERLASIGSPLTVITDRVPSWSRSHARPTPAEAGAEYPVPDFAELAYGWPRLPAFFEMRTTRRYREGKPAELESVAYGLPIGSAQFRGSTWKNAHALPLRPIWSGLAINTLFYAALLWVGFCGPFALRRHVRRKCGRCITCGYDLRGDLAAGCPECGWNREAKQ